MSCVLKCIKINTFSPYYRGISITRIACISKSIRSGITHGFPHSTNNNKPFIIYTILHVICELFFFLLLLYNVIKNIEILNEYFIIFYIRVILDNSCNADHYIFKCIYFYSKISLLHFNPTSVYQKKGKKIYAIT